VRRNTSEKKKRNNVSNVTLQQCSQALRKTTCSTEDFLTCRERVMGYDQRARIARHTLRYKVKNATLEEKMRAAKLLKSVKAKTTKERRLKKTAKFANSLNSGKE
jgi:hypothetical protein